MERSSAVCADSNYFVALFNPADTRHNDAMVLTERLDGEKVPLVVSSLIFLEVVTVLSQRRDKQSAIAVGRHMLTHPLIEIIHIDESLHERAWQIFQTVQGKNVSFVDASILAVMEADGIVRLLTFDRTDFRPLQKKRRFTFFE